MIKIYRTDLSFILNEIANQLDLPESLHEEAVKRYQAVGKWLGEGDSPLAIHSPIIYPQGSFHLGTVTKRWGFPSCGSITLTCSPRFCPKASSTPDAVNCGWSPSKFVSISPAVGG